jgi:hypothetical protein
VKPRKIQDVVWSVLPVIDGAVLCFGKGVSLHFLGTESELMQNGIVTSDELPGPRRGSCRHLADVRVGRNADGRCNVRIYGVRAARLDLGFQDFMHGLLADRQLSLVVEEKGGQEHENH